MENVLHVALEIFFKNQPNFSCLFPGKNDYSNQKYPGSAAPKEMFKYRTSQIGTKNTFFFATLKDYYSKL